MKALGLAFLALTSAAAGAAIATYAIKKRDDIDRYDFEFDEDDDFLDDDEFEEIDSIVVADASDDSADDLAALDGLESELDTD
jgi:hypothetical protein